MGWNDLQGFVDYLVHNDLVPAQYAKFYGMWVKRYLVFSQSRPDLGRESARSHYLAGLRQDPGVKDWQYRQADDATKMYLTNYLTTLADHGGGTDEPLPAIVTEVDALEAVRTELRLGHYSYRTEKTYLDWIKRFFDYLDQTGRVGTPAERVSTSSVRDFLTQLATRRNVAASTQNQAFSALLFLCRRVVKVDLQEMSKTLRARRGTKLPVVLRVGAKTTLHFAAGHFGS